jgi:hypothetical protein
MSSPIAARTPIDLARAENRLKKGRLVLRSQTVIFGKCLI